jgi:hypothetical protein
MIKLEKVYWTPFRFGLAVIYQNQNENVLRYSKNFDPNEEYSNFNIFQ